MTVAANEPSSFVRSQSAWLGRSRRVALLDEFADATMLTGDPGDKNGLARRTVSEARIAGG